MKALDDGFPRLGAVCRWRRVVDGAPVEVVARVKRWRPCGDMRVYTFDIGGEESRGVIDREPMSGRLTLLPLDGAADRPLPLNFPERPHGR